MQPPESKSEIAGSTVGKASPADWLTPMRFAFALAVLVFAAFPQVLSGLQTYVVRDFGFFAYPLAYFQRECFWRGELPLWNPYNNCGVPFLAQWNTMPLYPPALIYLLLPLSWSLSFFCLLHLWFAGLGAYFLARRWTGNNFAAAVAGVAFAFNGLTLNLLMWPSHIATLAWMPWVVLVVERAWQEGGRKILLAALVGTLQMLAGGPETILFTWLLLAAMWGQQLVVGNGTASLPSASPTLASRPRLAMLWRFPFVALLVATLAAAQLLPFLDLVAHSQREEGFADTRWSMPGWGWVNFLVPMAFGRVWNMGVFFQHEQSWTSSYYLGMGVLLLALLAIWTVRERRVWLLAAVAGAALVLAFGDQTFAYRGLRRVIPQLSLITYPVKFVTLVAFVSPLLAAFALARLQNLRSEEKSGLMRRLTILTAVLLTLVAVILLCARLFPFPTDNFPAATLNGLTRAAFLAASIGVLLMLARMRKPVWQRFGPLAFLLVAWLDVLTHEPTQNPTVPPSVYDLGLARSKLAMQPQPALGESRAMVAREAEWSLMQFTMSNPRDNFLVKRLGYFADCNLLDGVPKVNGFFSLYPRESGELMSQFYMTPNPLSPRLMDFLGVSQITAPGKSFEWETRATFLPLATAGQKPVFLDDMSALRTLTRSDFDATQVVFLPPAARTLVSVTNQTSARVLRSHFSTQRVDLEVEAAEPSLVVVAQTFYHPWRAYVGEKPVQVLRVNYGFQAIEIPAGRHQIRLVYEDRMLQIGLAISGLTLLGCGIGWVRTRRRAAS